MSTRSWFKAHRKQVVTHTSIVVAFVVFLIFVSGPLFDKFERVANESSLCEIALPASTNNIQYWIDDFQGTAHILEIRGWAFIRGQDSLNNEKYIVLESTDRTYVFTTETMIKAGVTQLFGDQGLNLDYSGFVALIPTRKIDTGKYKVGVYIVKGDVEALQYTNKVVDF
jgi:hypothetical protein